MASRRVHVLIRGDIQGVGFRHHTAKKARELGLSGFVRNLPHGSVEIVAEGETAKVEELLVFCRRGPPMATVTEVVVEEEKVTGEFEGFAIQY